MMTVHQYFLLKLAEECAEVQQRALKQMQFGKDENQAQGPSTTKIEATNAQRLRGEINDLLAVIDCLIDIGEVPEISPWELEQAKNLKKEKLLKYLNYSRTLKKVEPYSPIHIVSCRFHIGGDANKPKPECQAFYGADDICGLPPDSPVHGLNGTHKFVPKKDVDTGSKSE